MVDAPARAEEDRLLQVLPALEQRVVQQVTELVEPEVAHLKPLQYQEFDKDVFLFGVLPNVHQRSPPLSTPGDLPLIKTGSVCRVGDESSREKPSKGVGLHGVYPHQQNLVLCSQKGYRRLETTTGVLAVVGGS